MKQQQQQKKEKKKERKKKKDEKIASYSYKVITGSRFLWTN